MLNQHIYENPLSETLTPQEILQYLLAEIEISKQEVEEISDEALDIIFGGVLPPSLELS
jgi:hypothetical protein